MESKSRALHRALKHVFRENLGAPETWVQVTALSQTPCVIPASVPYLETRAVAHLRGAGKMTALKRL